MDADKESLANELAKDPEIVKDLIGQVLNLTGKEKALLFKKGLKTSFPTNSTYYKEKHGLQLKPDLDYMMEHPGTVLYYPYEEYRDKAKKTLYMYVNDGIRYLCDYLDPDKKYTNFRERIDVGSDDNGVYVRHKGGVQKPLKAKIMTEEQYNQQVLEQKSALLSTVWRDELSDWMNSCPKKGEIFEREVALSDLDVVDLNNLFGDDNMDYGLVITKDKRSFKVRRMSDTHE